MKFGAFEVDLQAGEVFRHGLKVRLAEQPFRILAILLARPGLVVTRDQLYEKLWAGDSAVDCEHGLNGAIRKLRYALGDTGADPRFIETLTRRGYRFIAPVEIVDVPARLRFRPSAGLLAAFALGVSSCVAILWLLHWIR